MENLEHYYYDDHYNYKKMRPDLQVLNPENRDEIYNYKDHMMKFFIYEEADFQLTPSQELGYTLEQEFTLRLRGCLFIAKLSKRVNVPQKVLSSAIAFFQRHYMYSDFNRDHYYEVAAASFILALKNNSHGYSIREVTKQIIIICNNNNGFSEEFYKKEVTKWRQTLLTYEHLVAISNNGDFNYKPPEEYIRLFKRTIEFSPQIESLANDIIYESFVSSTMVLRYPPAIIAGSALFLATMFLNENIHAKERNKDKIWLDELQLPIGVIKDCSDYFLDNWEKRIPPQPLP
ncbi:hypothetical protein K502DRAFT_361803 [Neoconidiobolus thromboides FSU 785]|nr:hypothetical protein K502DRAFT_361803 [Neoconidiobolus thromboides FSU 785]